MANALVVFSGGQDSTYCLYWALNKFQEVDVLTFDYGQRHNRELEAAKAVVKRAIIDYPEQIKSHEILSIDACAEVLEPSPNKYKPVDTKILCGTSPLVSDEKLEQYESPQHLPGGLEKTFVPMRNQMFLTIAANRAFINGCSNLVTGVCEEDSGGYPDCRQSFIKALEMTINEGTFNKDAGFPMGIFIHTPLMHLTKAQTVHAALEIPGCYAATGWSHTAYDGQYPPLGHDHATLLRAKGFEEAGIPDPLILRAFREGLMPLPITENYHLTKITHKVVQDFITHINMTSTGGI